MSLIVGTILRPDKGQPASELKKNHLLKLVALPDYLAAKTTRDKQIEELENLSHVKLIFCLENNN